MELFLKTFNKINLDLIDSLLPTTFKIKITN
jgi:hypothetical protein